MDANLPVDIKLSGLGDWLSSRRYINSDWANKIKDVRKKIAAALLDMPEDPRILKLLSNSYINYYNCCEIVEILKETEKDSKNFLGFYSSQRMKDWKEIVSLYEKDNLHIAEAAQQLNQLVKFDIPSLKRELNAQDKKINDRNENSKQQLKQSEDLKRVYQSQLNKRGLKGENLRLEFFQKTESLDTICSDSEKVLKELSPARDYYANLRSIVLGNNKKSLLPILGLFYSTNGEAAAYQWLYGAAPSSIDCPNFKEILATIVGADAEDEIDFGDEDINLDVDIEEAEIIDFEAHEGFEDISSGGEIIRDCNVQESSNGGVAVGQEALSLVQNEATREILKGELTELLYFLKAANTDSERSHPASLLLTGYDAITNKLDMPQSRINEWMKLINTVLNSLNSSNTIELFQIRTDPSYVQQLIDQVKEPLAKSKRLEECSKLAVDDIAKMKEDFQKGAAQVREAIIKAGKLEKQLCSDMTKFTKGRPVHLMGGVKSVETA